MTRETNATNTLPLTQPLNADASLPLAYSYRRVSSEKQLQGEGIERQIRAAQEWCERNGHILSTATFEDLGVSAYHGANSEVGALRAFLEAVENGAVAQGSTLLVESLDRLSRQHWRKGVDLLHDIVDAGINLVTLFDNKVYAAGQPIDFADAIMILVHFERAHNESETKSKRLVSAWKSNTEATLAGDRIRTSQCPSWLTVKGDLKSGKYKVIESKAKVVREVFSRFAEGEGPSAIARDLEARGVPPFRRGHWRGATISALLRSEAPYGHLELGRNITPAEKDGTDPLPKGMYRKGDRVIIEVAKGILPRVVDEDTERRVRFRLENREGEVKTVAPVQNLTRQTKAMLTGVLKGDLDENLKRKSYARTAAYVSPVSNKYYGAVPHIDQVLVDYWPDLRKATQVQTDGETEGLEAALLDAQETLELLRSRPSTKPRLLLAAEAEVEELEAELKARQKARGIGAVDLPRSIEGMEPHEVNALVRQVIREVRVFRSEVVRYETQVVQRGSGEFERKVKVPVYDLQVTLKNGLVINLGEGAGGLQVQAGV